MATERPSRVAAHEVDRPDRRRELPADEPPALAEDVHLRGQQGLQVRLDAVLDQPGVDPELVRGVVVHLVERDDEPLARLVASRSRCRRRPRRRRW